MNDQLSPDEISSLKNNVWKYIGIDYDKPAPYEKDKVHSMFILHTPKYWEKIIHQRYGKEMSIYDYVNLDHADVADKALAAAL